MFVDFFIRRPIFASVCALLIVLAGAIAIPNLPVAAYPQLAPPQVSVSASYTGASAQTVETAVTIPLEEAINGVHGLDYLTSTSDNNGQATVTAVFKVGTNLDLAAVAVQNRVQAAEGLLPAQVIANGLSISKNSSSFVMAAGFFAPGGQYNNLFISNYLDVYVADALKRVPGVANVMIFGERRYAMRLWLDPDRLAARGLTADDVINALREQNVQIPAGSVGEPPANPNQSYQMSVRVAGQLTTPQQFDDIVVKSNASGAPVLLKDVGYAQLGAENYASGLEYSGFPAMGVGVLLRPDANALAVDAGVRAELKQLRKTFPPGLRYAVAFDTTTAVRESIADAHRTLGEAIVLVILVMFLFLQDWRITVIPAITIPVSLVGTFAFVKLFGFSINTLTLFGIILATGLVVDDAIVVIENVERHISEGLTESHLAASVAMKEVTGAVIATSLVLIAVFVPVALFPGTTGILFKQFALTIAFSIAISAFNALTLTPALSALLLREMKEKHGLFHLINAGLQKLTDGYQATLRFLAGGWRWAMLAIFIAGLGLTWWLFHRVPAGFLPNEDQGYMMVFIQSPPGASLNYTKHIAREVETVLMRQRQIAGVFAVSGFSFSGNASTNAMVFASLKPFSQRTKPADSAGAVVARLGPQLFAIPGAEIFPLLPPPIQGVGSFGGFSFQVVDQQHHTAAQLAAATEVLVRAGNADQARLRQLRTAFVANNPQFSVSIDRDLAKQMHVSIAQIGDALQVFLGSEYVNNFNFNHRSYRVFVQAEQQYRDNPREIGRLMVRSDSGQMVPLADVVHVSETAAPTNIDHFQLFRSAEIDGSAAPGTSSGQAMAEMERLAAKVLPRGFGYKWSGLSRQEQRSGKKAAMLFGLGLLVVFLTLAAQYESWVLPLIILLAVPLAILGGLTAQGLIWRSSNDVYCQIGLVMLIGLASKNAILIVEFAEQLRDQGRGLLDAIVEAARIRLRPILMTSFAFILGVLPLVFAQGAGKLARHSVGRTVFGGMLAATLLNLIFIPLLYFIVRTVLPGSRRGGEIPAMAPES